MCAYRQLSIVVWWAVVVCQDLKYICPALLVLKVHLNNLLLLWWAYLYILHRLDISLGTLHTLVLLIWSFSFIMVREGYCLMSLIRSPKCLLDLDWHFFSNGSVLFCFSSFENVFVPLDRGGSSFTLIATDFVSQGVTYILRVSLEPFYYLCPCGIDLVPLSSLQAQIDC